MTLTKKDIKDSITNQLNISKTQSSALVESFFESIKGTLESGENIMISGFGKFSVQNKNERRGRNPQTGESIMIEPRKVVTFTCSGKLRDKMNRD